MHFHVRRVASVLAFLLFTATLSASTVITTLIDTDNSTATGCSVRGMNGVEHVVTLTIDEIVTAVRRQSCAGGVLTLPSDEPAGWPAPLIDNARFIEARIPYSLLGMTRSTTARYGFIIEEPGRATSVFTLPNGDPILHGGRSARRRSVRPAYSGPAPVLDGNPADWDRVPRFFSNGNTSFRMTGSGEHLFFRFDVMQPDPAAPVADGEQYSLPQGSTLTIAAPGVLANDRDSNGLPLTATLFTQPLFGALTLGSDGGFTYVHDGSAEPTDAFQYTAGNGTKSSNVATVLLNIDVNRAPVARNDAYSGIAGGRIEIPAPGVLANDSDADSDALTPAVVTHPSHGTLTLANDGSFVYVHDGSASLADSFSYSVNDGTVSSAPAIVTITLAATNHAPVAVADSYQVALGGTLTIPAPGVLANDSDPDGNALTATVLTAPLHGTLTLAPNGSFTYVHDNSSGDVTFTYTVNDGTAVSNVATVTITPVTTNQAPVANDDAYSILSGATLNIAAPGVLANDTDADGDPLNAIVVTPPAHGALTLSGTGALVYIHDGSDADSFSYRATDGIAVSNLANVTISLTATNAAPVAVNDTYAIDAGQTLVISAPGVLANDSDADGDPLTAEIVTQPLHGVLTFGADGAFTYVHDGGASTFDTFTYRANDGRSTTEATVTIAITPAATNGVPVAVADAFSVDEDAVLTGSLLANDSDPENDPLTAQVVTQPSGALALQPDGSFTYTPLANFAGADVFTYRVTDGALLSNVVAVALTINAVNDAPIAEADDAAVLEADSVDIAILGNDSDIDSATLTPVIGTSPAHGVAVVNGDGSVTYTHDGSETTSDSFTYHVTDGSASSSSVTVTLTITPVNDLPVANDDSAGVNEGASVNVAVLTNDNDAEASALTVAIVAQPAHGTVVVNGDGTVTYTHDGSETTTDSFTYRANDGTGNGNVATVAIVIAPVNDAPVAADDQATLSEGASTNVAVLTNDSDSEGSALSVTIVANPSHGTVTVNGDGTVTYTHDGSETTTDSFTYTSNDGLLASSIATVNLTINAVNDLPASADDAATVNEGAATTIAVLTNDSDGEGAALTPSIVTSAAHGTLVVNGDGSITYTHDGSETISDSFTYRANDGSANGNGATVTITINALNDTPAAANDNASVNEGASTSIAVLANDSDAEGASLTPVIGTAPAHGTLAVNGDGSITYTHDGSETTSDSFSYTITDGVATSTAATATITINAQNDAPIAANDSASVNEGASTSIAVLDNDSDADSTLTPVLDTLPSHGVATINADGSIAYTHDGSETTSDSFTYHATDGAANSSIVTVTITINPLNDPPLATNDSASVNEGASVSVAVLSNDSDAEGATLTPVIGTAPAHGTAVVNGDGTVTYTHDGSETTSDSFTYTITDGSATSTAATVTITINAQNDAPVAANDSASVNEGASTSIAVLDNDSDADSTLTPVLDTLPSHGVATINADGNISYTHDGSETTSDSFTYHATDGAANSSIVTVTITINPLNDTPVATNDSGSVNEGASVSVAVLSNDSDAEGASLTAVIGTAPAHGTAVVNGDGTVTYTHDGSETTSDSFTYTITDGVATSTAATVTITVNAQNDAPIATNDSASVNEGASTSIAVLDNDSDADSTLTPVLDTLPSHGVATINADGSISYTHDGSETTSDSFTYRATDGAANSSIVTVTITINPLNDTPVATNDSASVNEGASVSVAILSNDSDAEGATLTPVIGTTPAHGTAVVNGDGTVTYTHDGSETTSDSFTYTITDGSATSTAATVTITINAQNDAPIATNDSASVSEGASTSIAVLDNDTDADSTLTPVLGTTPAHGTAVVNGDGTITYTHDGSETTSDSFTYTVSDGTATSNSATVTITITAQNDAPVATDDSASVSEGGNVDVAVLTNDSDGESEPLVPVLVAAPLHGTATINPSGTITYQHDGGETTSDTFTYRATDGSASSNIATVSITISSINEAPVAGNDAASVNEGESASIAVLANDSDPESATLTPAIVTSPLRGTAAVNGDGTITYTHDGSETISDSFTYNVTDGTSSSNTATVTITITPRNDLPVATNDSYTYPAGGGPLTVAAPGVLANDSDADSATLTAELVAAPSEGTLVLNNDGSFHYTKAASPSPSTTFTYRAHDGTAAGNTATVTLSLSSPPVADNDTYTIFEDNQLVQSAPGVLDGDSDAENDIAKVILVSGPDCDGYAAGTCGGFVSIAAGDDGLKDDGSFHFVPAMNFNGSVTVTYKLEDANGLQSNVATLTINVVSVNDAPSFDAGEDVRVDLNSDVYSVVWAENITAGASDESGQNLSFEVIPLNASLFQTFLDCESGSTNCHVAIDGIYIDPATGTMKFKPAANRSGSTAVFVRLIDDGGTDNGGDDSSEEWVFNLTIRNVSINDAPTFTGQNVTVLEDAGAKTVNAWATNVGQGTGDSGQTVSFVVSSVSDPSLFTVQPSISTGRVLTFTPAPNASGSATIQVYAMDNGGTANGGDNTSDPQSYTITITAVNDAPLFTKGADLAYAAGTTGAQSVPWATAISTGAANETQTLTFGVTARTGASLFSVPPAIDASGNLTFSLTGTSGLATIDVTLTDSGDTSNGGASTSLAQTFTINVGGVNSPPSFVKGANVTVYEDSGAYGAAWATSISAGPALDATQAVSFATTTNNNALFSVLPSIDATGTLTFTPAADAHGTATITVVALDDGGVAGGGDNESDAQTFTITISPINDRPALALATSTISLGVNRGVVSTSLFATPSAGPNETGQTPFTYTVTQTATSNPALFSVAPAIASNGTLTYTVAESATGSATFSVIVQDAGGTANGGLDTSLAQSFTIGVTNSGAPLVPADGITITAYANIPLSITAADGAAYLLLDGATDPESQFPLSVVVTQKPTNALVTVDDALGAFTFRSGDLTYAAGAIQPQQFKYRVCDAAANCSVERTVTVNFFAPLVFFTDDDTSGATGGLGTLDVPRKGLLSGFNLASAAPPATYVIMSGSYLTNSTGSATTLYLRGGDTVVGQGASGLTFASLGITDPPLGSLPTLPDLSTGTRPTVTIKDPFPNKVTSDPNVGALFVGLSGGTVKHLTITKENPDVGSWTLLATGTGFCCVGTPGVAGDYLFDDIIQTNGQGFVVSPEGSSLTVSNSSISGTAMFSMHNGTLTVTGTSFSLTGTAGRHSTFIQRASSGTQNLELYVDATSSISISGRWAELFRPEEYSTTLGWSTFTPLGTLTFDCPITISTTNVDYPALALRGRTGHTIALNGKVDVSAAGTQAVRLTAESTGAGSFTMSNPQNRFKTTASTYTSSPYLGNAIQVSDIGVGAAGLNFSNLSLKAGNLSFTDTNGGTAGPITVTSGTVNGNGSQPCVAKTNAANVTVSASVAFTNCTQ